MTPYIEIMVIHALMACVCGLVGVLVYLKLEEVLG